MRRVFFASILIVSALGLARAQTPASATEFMNRGIEAFKAGQYAAAATAFNQALAADPKPLTHLYLGIAYAAQVVPQVNTFANEKLANAALDQFRTVLEAQPDNKAALEQEAQLFRNIGRLADAKAAERRALPLDPENPMVPYTIGVLDWQEAYRNTNTALAREHLKDDGAGNARKSAALCANLQTQNTALVKDGIANLTKAIDLNPDYADAMTYLSLTYRRRADLHCFDPVSIKADLDLAEIWANRLQGVRARNSKAARPAAPLPELAPVTEPAPPPASIIPQR